MIVYVCFEIYWDSTEVICAFKTEEQAERWAKRKSPNGWCREYKPVKLR